MKGFYDKMLPSFVNKYGKKWGIKVGTVVLPELEGNNTMHSIDITPEMRESVMEGQTMFLIAGERGAEALDKAEEATARLDNLAVAREMEAKKKSAKAIRLATGWERGADGKWRYEIPDGKLKDVALETDDNGNIGDHLGNILEAPELFKAYPELKSIRVEQNSSLLKRGIGAQYFEYGDLPIRSIEFSHKYIDKRLNPELETRLSYLYEQGESEYNALRKRARKEGIDYSSKEFIDAMRRINETYQPEIDALIEKVGEEDYGYQLTEDALPTLLHEVQHAIQRIEGFAKGGEVSNPNYHRLAGEVESRNVQSRLGMTPEERRNTLLAKTADVFKKDQIFIMDGVGEAHNSGHAIVYVGPSLNMSTGEVARLSEAAQKLLFSAIYENELNEKKYVTDYVLCDGYYYLCEAEDETGYIRVYERLNQDQIKNGKGIRNNSIFGGYGHSTREQHTAPNELLSPISKSIYSSNEEKSQGYAGNVGEPQTGRPSEVRSDDGDSSRTRRRTPESGADSAEQRGRLDNDTQFRIVDDSNVGRAAREAYEARMLESSFQSIEALQDSMRSLMEGMKLIAGDGRKVYEYAGEENPYLGENALSSVNEKEQEAFTRLVTEPMMQAVAKLAKNKAEYSELVDYMFAKHGLERDRYMRDKAVAKAQEALHDIYANPPVVPAGLTAQDIFDAQDLSKKSGSDYTTMAATEMLNDLWN